MIFADKLIQLRKKSGWSQEELAEQMGVSRQSISKWEGAQSIPDLEKIIRLAKLFSVSTDYLLLDEMGEPEGGAPALPGKDIPALRRISMEEANAFLKIKEETARYIAWGVFLCILSPIVLLMLGAGLRRFRRPGRGHRADGAAGDGGCGGGHIRLQRREDFGL